MCKIKTLGFVVISLILMSCVTKPPVTTDYDTSFNFKKLKHYAWIELENEKVSTLENKREINAIETILNQKGFSKVVDLKQADFLLKTHTITDNKASIDQFYQSMHHRGFWGPGFINPHFSMPMYSSTSVREYKIGTLVLDIVDPIKKQVIWRGSVSKPLDIYKNRTPEERATLVMSNANHMLASFPPGVKP